MTKRVLYLCEGSNMAGAETYALTLMKGLREWTDWKFYCATFYEGIFQKELKRQEFKTVTLCGNANIKSIKKLIKYVKDKDIEIIHMIDLKSTVIGGGLFPALKHVKKIATIHGLPEVQIGIKRFIKYGFVLLLYYLILRTTIDKVICVSKDLSRKMEYIIGNIKCEVIHNGVYLENNLQKIRNKKKRNDLFVIGSVGRLEVVKGFNYLIEAAELLNKKYENVIFEIIGEGPLEKELKIKTKKLKLGKRVRFLGFRNDAKRLIEDMDLFVMPSLHEGIPYVLLEAMAVGIPVVCSAVGGIIEVIDDGINGILVPAKNSNALAETISKIIKNWDYAQRIGENGRRKINLEFSARGMVEKTISIYNEI